MWNPFASKPVTPPMVPSDTIVQLGNFDDNVVFRAFMMRLMFRFDDVLDAERLSSSLRTLIERKGWSKLGARLRLNSNNKLEYHIPAAFGNDRPAILYLNVKHDTKIADHKVASKFPRPSTKPAMVLDADEVTSIFDAPGFPTCIEDYLYSDLPQIGLYVISFEDATLVFVSWPHTLCDAMGLKALLNAWAQVMSGHEDQVPPSLAWDHDPLAEFGSVDQIKSFKLVDRLLSPWQGIVFAARYIFDLVYNKQEDQGVACIPAAKVKALKDEAMKQITAESPGSYVSEGDVLCAYWSRFALAHIAPTSTRTVSLMNAFGLREALSTDILPAPGAYLGNALLSVYAFFSIREIYDTPIYRIAQRIRHALIEQGTRQQLEAASATGRKKITETGYTPVYGDATMSLLIYTNWTKGKFFELDFSSAVVKEGMNPAQRLNKIGHPSYLQPHAYLKGFSARDAVAILGKDAQGNYWLSGTMRKGMWTKVAKALESDQYNV